MELSAFCDYKCLVKYLCSRETFVQNDFVPQINNFLTAFLQPDEILWLRNFDFFNITKILFNFMKIFFREPLILFLKSESTRSASRQVILFWSCLSMRVSYWWLSFWWLFSELNILEQCRLYLDELYGWSATCITEGKVRTKWRTLITSCHQKLIDS